MIPPHTSLLLVEDETLLRRRLCRQLQESGLEVSQAADLGQAASLLESLSFELALIDVNLPDGSGLSLLRQQRLSEGCAALVMTADADFEGAVEAMRLGAQDYLAKPFERGDLLARLDRAWTAVRRRRGERFSREQERAGSPDFYFGSSLQPLRERLERVLQAEQHLSGAVPAPILIEGETGSGKTSLARWIHSKGTRSRGPLVEVNCPALPENLAESELFGHERGAFTGADQTRIGLLEAASGGTLFLDELSSLSLSTQARLLKAVEDHSLRRVGGNRSLPVDVRIIAATGEDLQKLAAQGRFREDLRQRLDLIRLQLPPLRDRGADILHLTEAFAAVLCRRYHLPLRAVPAEGRARLLAHSWPGNVRELAHEIERSLVYEDDGLCFRNLSPSRPVDTPSAILRADFWFPEAGFSLDEAIDQLVLRALKQAGGNLSAGARLLGCTRDFVRYRIKARGLEVPSGLEEPGDLPPGN